jgi:carbamoyltransferase
MIEKNILGITCGGESGVALFHGNKLKFAVNEERFSRIKLDCSYPILSINWVLEESGLNESEIDIICYGFSNIESSLSNTLSGINKRMTQYSLNESEIILERMMTEISVDSLNFNEFHKNTLERFINAKVYCYEHHDSHKYAAFYGSEFAEALVVTSDGRGDLKSLTVSHMGNDFNNELYCAYSWESLGYFYGRITKLCGFIPNRHEGKITGLAAYGDPSKAISIMRKMIEFREGKLRTFPGDMYTPFFSNYSESLTSKLEKFKREDIAAAAQYHLEDIMTSIVKHYINLVNTDKVCLCGGVFSNVKLNQRIKDLDSVDDIFIYPNMSDAGICAGSVYKYIADKNISIERPIKSLYLGPEIDPKILKNMLQNESFDVYEPENIFDSTCDLLADGKIIGLVQGRSEFGPRALGNRSIIASCENPMVNQTINNRLGRTEFMPFAPSISIDHADKCLVDFNNNYSTRHMAVTYEVTSRFAKECPAVVHIDNTARPQIVHKEDNKFFYQLLNYCYERDKKMALVNTSFNLHEDPIISNEDDVVYTFMKGAVDYLLFPPYLCRYKKE